MAVASIQQMLSVTYTSKAISRVAASSNFIQREFGMQPGGPNENRVGHRRFSYDVFNDTRKVGRSVAPGQPAAISTRNPVGVVSNTFPRMHDSMVLMLDEIHNYRAIGGPNQVYDERGAKYITRQQRFLGQKAGNFRSLLVGGMLRGQLYAHSGGGTNIYYDYTSTSNIWSLDYKISAGNKTQLNMLGDGDIIDLSWDNSAANIPAHLGKINAAFQQLVGSSLQLCIVNNVTWNWIVNNDYVIQNSGSVSSPFDIWSRKEGESENGRAYTVQTASLKAFPLCRFIITDEGLDLGAPGSEAYTKFIPDGYAWFGPEPDPDYFEMLLGDEPISRGPNMEAELMAGLNAWTVNNHNPTSIQMFVLDNPMPALYVPDATAWGQVIFP